MERLEGKFVLYYPIDRWKPLIIQWITTQISEIKYRMPLERYFRNVSKKAKLSCEGPTLDCVGLFHCMQIGPPRPFATKYFTLTAACKRRVGRPNYATPPTIERSHKHSRNRATTNLSLPCQ